MNIIIIGHVDHGKSTTVGHTLVLAGAVSERKIAALEKEAGEKKDKSFMFAYVFDRLKEERERGLTIDLAFQKFETQKYYYTIIDAPGHRDFVKNMITGTSQADAAVLLVSAKKGEFEAGIGPGGQTSEHAYLAKTLGVDQIVVAINKMDATTPEWSQERYEEVKNEIGDFLKKVGYKVDQINFVPISGISGANLKDKAKEMPWYTGPTLLQAIDMFTVPGKPTDKPLRIPVENIYTIQGAGTVPVGRVETGILKVNDKILFEPSNKKGEVKSIEMHHETFESAEPGDNIGFNVRGIGRKTVQRGDVASHEKNPPPVVKKFTGQIIVLQHPTAIAVGYQPVMHAHTTQIATTFVELKQKKNPRTGEVIEENPKFIKTGESALVTLEPVQPMVLEKYRDIPQLGRFAIRDSGRTVAVGVVMDIIEKVR